MPRAKCAADGRPAQGLSGRKLGSHAKETVIANQPVARNARSMIGSARESMKPHKERMDCLAPLAMTVIPIEIVITGLDPAIHLLRNNFLRRWMDARIKSGHDECVLWGEVKGHITSIFKTASNGVQTRLRDLAARCARGLHLSFAPLEGVGNAGCPMHPRPRAHFVVVERTRVTTSTPESPGIPARNGFNGLCRALPGDRALLPPSSPDIVLSLPGWADKTSANLTPASGRQDHTILPSAATSLVGVQGNRS
jgi:hypothetical protein